MSSVLYRKRQDYPARGMPQFIPRLNLRNILWATLVALLAYVYWPRTVAVETVIPGTLGFLYHPDLSVYRDPLQLMLDSPPVVGRYKGFSIQPVAAFQMHGRLLHKTTYRFDDMAELSPVDMMLSWGPLADNTWEEDSISFRQRGRWGSYRLKGSGAGAWLDNPDPYWANMHMVPASAEVHRALRAVDEGSLIRLKGFLVNIVTANGANWESSLSRLDYGGSSCEIILVDDFEVLYR